MEKGDLVAGKYRVERVIGNGGMGQVVAARHVELGNLFAIKVLRPSDDEQTLVRFMREAQAIARLQNEHVVRVHDVGQTDRGLAYIIMEHLDGQDLGALLAARGPLPVDEAVGAILEACEGLADAHAIGIVHRDLKPQNLFLARKSASGAAAVKVVDFGLAKSVTGANGRVLSMKATSNGEIVGTAGYLAPEQMGGEATPRSDVWSLGVCLYRLLTGKHPFSGKNAVEMSVAALTAEFRPLAYFRADVPPAIEAVIARCLRKIPEERYADARALHDALLEAFTQQSVPESHTAATLTRQAPPSASSMVPSTSVPSSRPSMPSSRVTAPSSHSSMPSSHSSMPSSHSSMPSSRATAQMPATFAPSRADDPTVVKPRNGWEPSGPPPASFTTLEENSLALDRRSRLMLLGSGLALVVGLVFIVTAVAWRRSAKEATSSPPPPAIVSQVAPPPPRPESVVVASAPASEPAPAVSPEPATSVAEPEPAASAAAPEPEVASSEPAPVASPEPAPVASPEPAPVAAPEPVAAPPPKKAAKKKALYETP